MIDEERDCLHEITCTAMLQHVLKIILNGNDLYIEDITNIVGGRKNAYHFGLS